MLMNLLPGLRDLRAPLAAGFLWLAGLWLLLVDIIPPYGMATGVLKHIYALSNYVGHGAVLAALSFTAYLIGSVLSVDAEGVVVSIWAQLYTAATVLVRYSTYFHPRAKRRDKARQEKEGPSHSRLSIQFKIGIIPIWIRILEYTNQTELQKFGLRGRMSSKVIDDMVDYVLNLRDNDPPLPAPSDEHAQPEDRAIREWNEKRVLWIAPWITIVWNTLALDLLGSLIRQTRQLVTRLRVTSPSLFDQYDRARGEAEFRLSVAFPIVFIVVVLAWKWTPFWLLLLPAAVLILHSGMRRAREATDVVAQAALTGYVIPTGWPDKEPEPFTFARQALNVTKGSFYPRDRFTEELEKIDKILDVLSGF